MTAAQAVVFTNQPTGTVTSGGTTTSDTSFTVTATNAFPVASSTAVPATLFAIMDPALPTEIMYVTTAPGGTGSGQAWTVARAQEGTSGVSHSSNWTCVQVVTAGTLQNFKQATNAVTSAVTVATTTETVVAVYDPLSSDIVAGATFEAVAYGTFATSNATAANRQMVWTLRWGGSGSVGGTYTVGSGVALCRILTGTGGNCISLDTTQVAGASFDVNGTVTLLSSTTATANMNLFCTNSSNSLIVVQATAQATNATTGAASSATPVTISGSGPLFLTAYWGGTVTNQTLTATAPVIYRAA